MLIIGLTGGIGSGKTTVANCFAELGIPIIDADIIAREITEDKKVKDKLIEYFGKNILDKHQQLNRRLLREVIFTDAIKREWLEQLLHPLIAQTIELRLQAITAAYCILVIPLLLEKDRRIKVDRVLVIDTTDKLQAERTQQRDQINLQQFQMISESQLSRKDRVKQADDVILNDSSLDELKQQVNKLHQKYLIIAKNYKY